MANNKHPSDVRRQGRRLLKKLEAINLNEPLGPGLYAQLCYIARNFSTYKERE